jgi:hypothetical protein
VELYLHSPSTPSWRGVQLKLRDNFTLPLPIYVRKIVVKKKFGEKWVL